MTYTKTIIISILSDILLLIGIPLVFTLEDKEILLSGISLIMTITFIAIFLGIWVYRGVGKYRYWNNLWKNPMWQVIVYYVALIAGLSTYIFADSDPPLKAPWWWIIVIANMFVTDIRCYRNAVKYNLDYFNDINDVIKLHPEIIPIINRKPMKKGAGE